MLFAIILFHKTLLTAQCFKRIIYPVCYQAQRDRLQREEQMAQEERLARELERMKLEGIRDEKMRQQIRETR